MSMPLKVLWSEGVTLAPQHLQRQDSYHEARLQRMASALNPHLWGVQTAKWDHDALANNVLSAEALALIFQDGEIVDAPLSDPLPAPVDLKALPADEQSFTFYAALPGIKAHGGNLSDPAATNGAGRYAVMPAEAPDLYSEALHVDVLGLSKQLLLLSPLQTRAEHIAFPVLRIRRLASGGFEVDPAHVPPSVTVGGAAPLQQLLDKLLARLQAKVATLYERHRQPSKDVVEVHSGDLSSFWMLNTIITAAATLTHCSRYRHHHPEVLFDRLTGLAGGLMAFSTKYALAELPAYQHDDPAPGFAQLDAVVRDLVDTVISSKYKPLPLKQDVDSTARYRTSLDGAGPELEGGARLCVAVSADMPALQLVEWVPKRFKLAGPDEIEGIINAAVRGIDLVHLAQVPPQVPVRPNTYYFAVTPKGALFEKMLKSQALVIFVADGFDHLQLELFSIAS